MSNLIFYAFIIVFLCVGFVCIATLPPQDKQSRRQRIEGLKADIREAAASSRGYQVPIGFLYEPYDTTLHIALRELVEAKEIERGQIWPGSYERWVAPQTERQNNRHRHFAGAAE